MGERARDIAMSGNRTSVTVDRYPAIKVLLSCGCEVAFKASPPRKGEAVTCLTHGAVKVRKDKKDAGTQDRSDKNAT